MDDIVVVKAAHYVHDGVALADVAQELVAQAGALAGALDKACNVDKFHDGRRLFVGLPNLGQLVQPRVGHRHNAGVRLNGAERIVRRLRVLCAGQRIKKGGFAYIRKAHDT